MYTYLRDKQPALFVEHTTCPLWWTIAILMDKSPVLIAGQTPAIFEGHNTYHFWGTNYLPLLTDKSHGLFERQIAFSFWSTITCPFWGTNCSPFWETNYLSFWKMKNHLPYLWDKWLTHLIIGTQMANAFLRDKPLPIFILRDKCLTPFDCALFVGNMAHTFLWDKSPAPLRDKSIIAFWGTNLPPCLPSSCPHSPVHLHTAFFNAHPTSSSYPLALCYILSFKLIKSVFLTYWL